MLFIPDFLNAIAGDCASSILLTYGDTDAIAQDAETQAAIIAAAETAGEPLYVYGVAVDATVPFLYSVMENAGPDCWRDLTIPPTAALYKGGTLIIIWSLENPVPAEAVEHLAKVMGGALDEPIPMPGANGWELVHCDPETYTSLETLADAYDEMPSLNVGVEDARPVLNDARLLTPYDLDDPAYAQEMTISVGAGRDAVRWKGHTMPIATFVEQLSVHREAPKKDGLAFVLADLAGDSRRKVAVKACYGVGLDIDVGTPSELIDAALVKMGCLAIRYSTHSHAKESTLFRKDRLTRYANLNGCNVDNALVQQFLCETENWDPALVETAIYVGDRHEPEGMMVQIDHAAMPKHRVVMPLVSPFVITEVAETQDEGMRMWAEVPKALARALGDLPLDKAALDPSRLFYFPTHAKGRPFEIIIVGGPLLDWRDLGLTDRPKNGFDAALSREVGASKGRSTTAEGQALARWSIDHAAYFQAADAIRDHDPGRVRSDGSTKIEIECPFDEEHSNPGDPKDKACMVINAGDGTAETFIINCRHDSCQSRTGLDMLGKLIADNALPTEVLEDDAYNPLPEGAAEPAPPSLAAAFPPPSSGHGDYAYQMFDGRPWLHRLSSQAKAMKVAERLHTPCYIESGIVFPDRDNQRGLRVKVLDENGETQAVDITAGMAVRGYGADLRVLLREKGVLMTEEGENHLVKLFKQVQPADPITVYNRPGWHNGAFITPWGKMIGSNRPLELSPENQPSGEETAGTLSGWIDATACAFHSNVLHFQVGVLAGLVSPMLDLCSYPSVWIAYSGSTSKGKSTAQKLQAACWGDPSPKKGLFGNFNGTAAASEALLARASGAGYAFDEAHTIDGGELQKLMFKASGDGGADRLKRTADLRAARSWTLLVTLSNETSLYQKIRGSGAAVTTGLGARALDLNVEDAPALDPATMKRIEAAFANHGHAGQAFVRAMISLGYTGDPDSLCLEIEEKADILAGEKAEPPVRRAARIAGLIWQAGVIAQFAGLVPEAFDVEAMARRLWGKVMEAETAPGSAETMAIRTLFETLIKRRGVDVAEDLGSTHREAVAWRPDAFKTYGAVYIVSTIELAALAGGSLNHTAVTRALAKRGLLIPNERTDKPSYIWDSVPGLGRVRAVVIPAKVVEGLENEEEAA